MYNFVARFLFKNEVAESLLIEVRTAGEKLFTAIKVISSQQQYQYLT